MIGDVIRLGRGLEQQALDLFHPLQGCHRSVSLSAPSPSIEQVIKGLWKGQGLTGGLLDYFGKGSHELLAGGLVTFVAFIPFFAFRELGRVLGEGKIWTLFFQRRADRPIL